jgi:WD40 repeat protein
MDTFSPDGSVLATAQQGRGLLWDPVSGKELRVLAPAPMVSRMAFSPQGGMLAVANYTVRPGLRLKVGSGAAFVQVWA